MSIPSYTVRITPSLARNTLNRYGRYTWGAIKNYGVNLSKNLPTFSKNAFILSSLVLVGYRVVISAQSAKQSKGQPDAQFQAKEAAKTRFREIAGWTFSYL